MLRTIYSWELDTPCLKSSLLIQSCVQMGAQTKQKQRRSKVENKKKTGKTWCSTSTVPSSHATTERARERENSHTRVLLSQPAALHCHARENATLLHTNSVYLHTPFPYNSTHTPTLRMFQYQPVNQSLSNLTAWSNQYNSIRPHCLHCLQRFLEKTWVKDVCFPSMSDFLALWVNTLADDQAESGALHLGKTRKFTLWLPKPETENYSWHTPHLNIRFVLPENVIWQSLQETLLLGISCISRSNISTSSSREPDLMRNL